MLGLAIYDSGSRNFYNTRRPVDAPSDLHGLKLRVPQSDIFIESVAALGASPTPLAYGAVFSALQTHLIDGAENNWPSYYSSRHFEIATLLVGVGARVRAGHAADVEARRGCACRPSSASSCSHAARASVPPDARALGRARYETSRRAVLDAGVSVEPVDKAAFRTAVQPLLDRYLRDPEIERLYDEAARASRERAAVARIGYPS